MNIRAGGPRRVRSLLRVTGAVGIAHRRPSLSPQPEVTVILSPKERAEFKRELPVVILALVLLFLVLGAMLMQVPVEVVK